MRPGRYDQTLVITARGTAEAPVIVRFAPGRYDVYPTHAERRYRISNNNDAPDSDKVIGLLIGDSCHVHVIGPGSQLMHHGKVAKAFGEGVEVEVIPHAELKERSHSVKTIVRAGDFTAWGNVLLVSGAGTRWRMEK